MSQSNEKSGMSTGCMLLSGAGCLVLFLLVIAGVVAAYIYQDRIAAEVTTLPAIIATVTPMAITLNDYADTWVVEKNAANPGADDLVVIRVQGDTLIGEGVNPRHQYRMVLSSAADGRLTGTATVNGANLAVAAELSADKSHLTVVIRPDTADADTGTAVLIRYVPPPAATTLTPARVTPARPTPARAAVTPPRRNPAPARLAPRPVPEKPDSPRPVPHKPE